MALQSIHPNNLLEFISHVNNFTIFFVNYTHLVNFSYQNYSLSHQVVSLLLSNKMVWNDMDQWIFVEKISVLHILCSDTVVVTKFLIWFQTRPGLVSFFAIVKHLVKSSSRLYFLSSQPATCNLLNYMDVKKD